MAEMWQGVICCTKCILREMATSLCFFLWISDIVFKWKKNAQCQTASHLCGKHTTALGSGRGGKQFLVLSTNPHPWEWGEILTHNSHASRLGFVVTLQEPFMRQSSFCGLSEGCLSKQTAVSIVLNVLHVHVRKQKPVISEHKRFPGAVFIQSFC